MSDRSIWKLHGGLRAETLLSSSATVATTKPVFTLLVVVAFDADALIRSRCGQQPRVVWPFINELCAASTALKYSVDVAIIRLFRYGALKPTRCSANKSIWICELD
jgi:hypothetical protein